MLKVCFIVSSLCNEGPVNVMYNIIRYMDFSAFEVSIITLIPEKKTSRLQDFERLPIQIFRLSPDKNPKTNPVALYKKVKHCLSEIEPHILHAHCPLSLYLLYFLPKKYQKVYTIHIYPGKQQEVLYGKFKGKVVIALNNFVTRRLDLPIGCAESVGELYKANKGWDIPCIPNGCSLPLWQRDDNERQRIRRDLGLRDDIRYFIFIGRFSAEKKPEFLAEVFNNCPRKDIGIIMLGDGPLRENLLRFADERVLLPGFKTNVYDYLIASDFYISASDVEGLANTLLESMSVGLPMLLSDIPSHREVMRRIPQEAAFIYNNSDAQDVYLHIERLLSIDYHKASEAIRQTFSGYYTARRMSSDYQKAYTGLFSKRSKQ